MDRISVRLLAATPGAALLVAAAARVSLSRKPIEDLLSMGEEEVARWAWELVRRSHGSPLEHASYTFLAEGCSRVCTHQLVRHRLASYTQQSMRYTDGYIRLAALRASEALGLDCPASRKARGALDCYARALAGAAEAAAAGEEWAVEAAREAFVFPQAIRGEALASYASGLLGAASSYYRLQAAGVPMEEARYLLPQSARSRIVFTMNARELLESFIPLRTCARAQAEMRLVAWRVLWILREVEPAIFRYAGPRCVLLENRVRGDPRPLEDYLEGRAGFTIERCPELVPRQGIRACLSHAASSAGTRVLGGSTTGAARVQAGPEGG
ncbi:MAG: FAD-dependent thymidylate synthase [Desulfurococcales archaeon]|nr:FAD-dependent thymidylate synthase [Desulfurococcales archaeon]